jgi:G6PDH family F420-dependent oxidoreductase
VEWGYTLSSEEHTAPELVDMAKRAEELGFSFLTISDHYHPWIEAQGHSPFAWTTAGAVASHTSHVRLGTGVTCPIIRYHPAIVAQAAATVAELMPGRFFLGLGTGEALNEHIFGSAWPAVERRRAMLAEATEVIRRLWTGETVDFWGEHYTVENARLFDPPPEPIPIIWAASGAESAAEAAQHADGLWSTSPDAEVVSAYRDKGGQGSVYGQVTICWATSEEDAKRTAVEKWPNAAIPGQMSQDLPTWTHFGQLSELVGPEHVAEQIVCGPDPGPVVDAVRKYAEAGFDHLHLHQVGDDQEGFFEFWERSLSPALAQLR